MEMAEETGLGIADALHISSAAGRADCFLTVDEDLLRMADRIRALLNRSGLRLAVLGLGDFEKWPRQNR